MERWKDGKMERWRDGEMGLMLKLLNSYQLPTVNCQLPTEVCRLRTADCQLLTVNCQLKNSHKTQNFTKNIGR